MFQKSLIGLGFIGLGLVILAFVFYEFYAKYKGLKTPYEPPPLNEEKKLETAFFAGGCFWCVEKDFEKLQGVKEVVSGYMGGSTASPTYAKVSSGTTGHFESVQVWYDPEIVGYEDLLEYFWRHINPTDIGGQFVDRGQQYSPVIFYATEEEKEMSEKSKKMLQQSKVFDRPVTVPILPISEFFPAETYHQDYYKKNPIRYKYYRKNSGRDQFLEQYWK